VAEAGFSREGQLLTRPEKRPGEQRAGSLLPQGELSGQRDARGTEEAIDEAPCSGTPGQPVINNNLKASAAQKEVTVSGGGAALKQQ
jgi:hypothetical protein